MDTAAQVRLAAGYYARIHKPIEAKQKPQFALAVIGLVGAGKSTVLRKISALLPMVSVSGDDLRRYMAAKGMPEHPGEVIAEINQRVIGKLRSDGYRYAYDNDFANMAICNDMLADNARAGIPVFWIRVVAPEAVIIERLQARDPGHFADAHAAVANYHRRKVLHESIAVELAAIPYIHTFNTAVDLDGQVAIGVQKLRNKLKGLGG